MSTVLSPGLEASARRLEREPNDPGAWAGAARALEAQSSWSDAAQAWRKSLELAPNSPDGWLSLGRVLARLGVQDDPARCYRNALSVSPGRVDALVALGLSVLRTGDVDEAGRCFAEALARDEHHDDALAGAAMVLERRGLLDDAWNVAERARSNHVLSAVALTDMALQNGRTRDALRRVQRALSGHPDNALLLYAKADLLDRTGQHQAAFVAYARANRAQRVPFDGAEFQASVEGLKRFWTAERFTVAGDARTERPVFLVGAPRSGTSLVEQILSRHPDVHALGESTLLGDVAGALPPIDQLTNDAWSELADAYLSELPTDGKRVVDKMPANLFHLGIVGCMFPAARIVFVERAPVDVGWSCFRQPFGAGHAWATDLGDIAAYLQGTGDLAAHWRSVLPVAHHTVRYEHLVEAPESEVDALLGFLGLSACDDCLRPEEAPRHVATRSRLEVQRPIHAGSVGRSAPYHRWLADLTG